MGKFENEKKYVTKYNGTEIEYNLGKSFVSITRNGKLWGVPQGDRFFRALLADIEILQQDIAMQKENQNDQSDEKQIVSVGEPSKDNDLIIKVMFPNRTVKEFSFDELKTEDRNSFSIGKTIEINNRVPKYVIRNITVVKDGTITIEVY